MRLFLFRRAPFAALIMTVVFFSRVPLYSQTDPAQAAPQAEEQTAADTAEGANAEESGASADADAANAEPEEPPPPTLSPEELAAKKEKEDADRMLDMDLRTSTLQELAIWAKELGLSEGGSRAELLARLRQHYNIQIVPDEPAGGASGEGEESTAAKPKEPKVITIEKAAATEYFTIEAVDEDYARLSGGVAISLKDGDSIHKISAWEILYNRTRNIVTASGNVKYVREENDTTETFEGDSITINLDTWVGSFIDTVSQHSLSGSGTAYRFAGQVISKNESETTVLKNARITNAAQEESFWSIDASKLWILPGSDWALFNGVLKVGEVPVLWLPAFLFPADEAIFHPVVGNRTRDGNYFQTTTYIWGRPENDPSKENSISKILGSGADMEKVRNGVFLRSTRRKRREADAKKFSILLDGYANLGFYTGLRLELPKIGFLNSLKFDGGLGWTRTVFESSNGYFTPYESSLDSTVPFSEDSDWNKSNLFGAEVPFRYRLKTSFGFSGKFGSITFDFPMYSDPWIDQDTQNRQEMIDWMSMLKSGQFLTEEDQKKYTIGSYQWTMSLSPNLSTTIFSPYISTLSINSFQSYLQFGYKELTSADLTANDISKDSPSRAFYYPDKLTMYSVSGSLGGTPLTLRTVNAAKEKDKEIPDPLEGIGTPLSPWKKTEAGAEAGLVDGTSPVSMNPPALSQTFTLPKTGALTATWTYRFNPSSAGETQFDRAKWNKSDDIDWGDIASMFYNFRSDGSTNISISESNNGLFTLSAGLSGNAAWQDHTYINTESEMYKDNASQKSIRLADYQATTWTTSYTGSVSIKPLYWSNMFSASTISYNLGGLMAKSIFDYNKINYADNALDVESIEPEWDVQWGDFIREDLSAHNISTNLSASIMEKTQSLSFSASLPPLYQTYTSNAAMRIWISETTASASVRENPETQAEVSPETSTSTKWGQIWPGWTFSTVNLSEALTFGTNKSLRQSLAYDPELDEWTSANTTLTFGKLSASFAAARMYKYEYQDGQGWVQITDPALGGEQILRPRDLNITYSNSMPEKSFFNSWLKFTFNINTSLSFDLQRYTYSRFNLTLGFTLNINKFLQLSMSTTNENASIYRYIQDLPMFSDLRDKQEVPGEKNIFIDLFNSFRFDDDDLRRSSGFKLKSFTVSATHFLGDWNATLSVTTTPSLDTKAIPQVYKFYTTVSFLIQWLPITEIKSDVYYDGKEEKFVKRD
ncbi:MAG: LPS-assembly protein LptD [Spirochaetaceae bacterium]|jgi:hypothetical protein|nr:LPS-assembly protein LptD [Spirochaetaceae bacterium]